MAKMGRPLKDVVKPKIVGVRMTEAEHAELQRRASEHNLSLTQAVQQAITLLYKSWDSEVESLP